MNRHDLELVSYLGWKVLQIVALFRKPTTLPETSLQSQAISAARYSAMTILTVVGAAATR
jgi:hypothetical protein